MPAGEELAFEFNYVKADAVAAQQLHARVRRRTWLLLILLVLASGGAVALWTHQYVSGVVTLMCVLVGGLIGRALSMLVLVPWRAGRNFDRQPLRRLPSAVTLLSRGLRVQSARGHSTLLWSDFHGWRADRRTVLMYLSPNLFIYIPARLTAVGFPVDALRTSLAREVGPPRR